MALPGMQDPENLKSYFDLVTVSARFNMIHPSVIDDTVIGSSPHYIWDLSSVLLKLPYDLPPVTVYPVVLISSR